MRKGLARGAARARLRRLATAVRGRGKSVGLVLAALGVVFGDIGTHPRYAFASQAVLAGAFPTIHQAMRLAVLTRVPVAHTAPAKAGQVQLPAVNLLLGGACLLLAISDTALCAWWSRVDTWTGWTCPPP